MRFQTRLLRPDDLLNLRLDTINLKLDASEEASPALVVENTQQPAYILFEFPPQSIAEGAYYEAAIVAPEPIPNRPDADQNKAGSKNDQLVDTPTLPGHLAAGQKTVAQLAHPSRLVFAVPADARIPYTLEGLLDWSQWTLHVSPIAAIGPHPTAQQIANAPAIQPPALTETAIEMPYRLFISPTSDVMWNHRVQPFFHAGRAEMWHTRLQGKSDQGSVEATQLSPLPLRALWSPDYNPANPMAQVETDPDLGRTAMSPRDRSQIVTLTSAFHGFEADYNLFLFRQAVLFPPLAIVATNNALMGAQIHTPEVITPLVSDTIQANAFAGLLNAGIQRFPYTITQTYVPEPFFAEQLFLSPLGGWLKSRGHWDPLPRKSSSKIVKRPDVSRLLTEIRTVLTPRRGSGNVTGFPSESSPPAVEGRLKQLLDDNALSLFGSASQSPVQLDLSEWVHLATQGRDHYVRIVYEGELWPFRHKAALVKVTERKFIEHDNLVEAHLIQRNFIVVREPEKTFADTDRAIPFKKVRLTTLVTPSIAEPDAAHKVSGTNRSFWVEVMTGATTREKFRFHGVGTDVMGSTVDFTVPLLFVSVSDLSVVDNMKKVRDTYNAPDVLDDRSVKVPGQKVFYAPPKPAGDNPNVKPNDNTNLITRTINFVVDEAGNPPRMLLAEVNIPPVQQLLQTDAPTVIAYFQDYLANGIEDSANQTGVFAQVVKNNLATYTPANPFAGLAADTLGVSFSSDKAGGFATPNMGVSALTSHLGPLAGDVQKAALDSFDPTAFFPKGGLAKLFGSFELADLLPPLSTHDKNAPKIQTTTQDTADGKLLTVTLDWTPDIQPIDLGIVTLATDYKSASSLAIHGVLTKPINFKDPLKAGDGTSDIKGKLTNFQVTILSSVTINFTQFAFEAQNGHKPDVKVDLDPATPLEFSGDLKFVEELRKAIPPGLFGDGPSLDISPTGIRAGFQLALPPVAVGVFALKDISLGASLTLPFLDGKPIFDFNVSERCHPFQLAVSLFAGGGFFHLQLDTAGMKLLEAALEFGAAASIDIGVASGEVHIMAGIYFALQRPEGGGDLACTLTGYLRLGGSLSVLGIVKVSVEFNLSFTYKKESDGSGKAYGRATLTVQVEVLFFSKSVELTVEKAFGGSSGDPTYRDVFDTPEKWNDYALAFA